jgi:integrase/recombinase XerD
MRSLLHRLHQTKLALLATLSTVAGVGLLLLAQLASAGHGWAFRDAVVNGFAFKPEALTGRRRSACGRRDDWCASRTVEGMTAFLSARAGHPAADPAVLSLAVAAYLARYKGSSRYHIDVELRLFLTWYTHRDLDPFGVRRADIERYVRWLQEVRRYRPSTVCRRLSVVTGFYRTCVIDGVLEHSPAEYVRRPTVPAESPTLGLSHLQFEALLTAARESANRFDFALVVMLGLLGLRIFEATGANIGDLGDEHGHRVLRVCGKGGKVVLVPLPPAVGRAIDQAVGSRFAGSILLNTRGRRMDRHAATRRLKHLAAVCGMRLPPLHPHMLRHTYVTTMLDAGVSLRDVQIAARHADPRTTMRYDRARKNLDRHPNYVLAAYMAAGT